MLRALAKSTVRPVWRAMKHRIEGIVEKAQLASTEQLSGEIKALGIEVLRLSEPAPQRLFPFSAPAERNEGAPGNLHLTGHCPVCGRPATFIGFTANVRESGHCSECGFFNRQRQMAAAIRRAHGIAEGAPLALPAGARVYNTETTGALHRVLSLQTDYVASEYFGPEFSPGADVGGRRHENLQDLSFDAESFDLILSSDVLEHMPDPYAANLEVFRVLKPGGRHIFTVPFDWKQPRDDVRAKLVDGDIVYLAERQFHGDPVRPEEGVLVWTIFGMEMLLKLQEQGFEVSAWNVHSPRAGIVGPMPIVFEARRPRGADTAVAR